jgi:biotin carboxyl carrier protein
MKYTISIKEQTFNIEVGHIGSGVAHVNVNGLDYDVRIEGAPAAPAERAASSPAPSAVKTSTPSPQPAARAPQPAAPVAAAGTNIIKAPIPGLIMEVKVKVGDPVTAGQAVIIMEAMKMENSITTPYSGTVKEVHVQKGVDVKTGSPLLVIG